MPSIQLGTRTITPESRPYVIAEIGVNHEGSIETARMLIRQAKKGGADAAKFQTYKAEKLAARESPAYWDLEEEPTESQYQLFKKHDTFEAEEYQALADYCTEVNIDFLSTPFDDEAVEFLNPLIPFFKVASADLTTHPFLKRIAACGKPVVLSTGGATLAEIDQAIHVLDAGGCEDIALLHCILNYPTENEDAHLSMIEGLQRAFPEHVIGYSDHTLPDEAMMPLATAYLLGAQVIEKHFTHDKTLSGNDHYHAMDVEDLQRFTEQVGYVDEMKGGSTHKRPLESEQISRHNARRSIVLAKTVSAGTSLTTDHLTYKRPATGISPIHWEEVLGRRVSCDLPKDHILRWEDLAAAQICELQET